MNNKEGPPQSRLSKLEQRKKIFQASIKHTATMMKLEQGNQIGWGITDSTLINATKYSLCPFEKYFAKLIPETENLKEYIEKEFTDRRGISIGVELGGTGSNMFADFTPGFFQKTAGINLTDYRDSIDPAIKNMDRTRNHSVIPGDITDENTHEKVKTWLGDQKIDVIFERMLAGHGTLAHEPFFLSKQANVWYKLLNEGGLFFAETPTTFNHILPEWLKLIENNYKETLKVDYAKVDYASEVVLIKKLKGAPEELPLVDARTVIKKQNKFEFYKYK